MVLVPVAQAAVVPFCFKGVVARLPAAVGGAAVGTALFGSCGCPPGGGCGGATCCPSHSSLGSSWLWWHCNELSVCGEMKNYAARQIGGL